MECSLWAWVPLVPVVLGLFPQRRQSWPLPAVPGRCRDLFVLDAMQAVTAMGDAAQDPGLALAHTPLLTSRRGLEGWPVSALLVSFEKVLLELYFIFRREKTNHIVCLLTQGWNTENCDWWASQNT